MPSVDKYRRTWFALLREAGIPDEDRHWVQETHTGKASTRDWGPADWRKAIAALQRDLEQHRDKSAHVREDRPAPVEGHGATSRQCSLIERICDEIEWRAGRERGPFLFLLRSVLRGEKADQRRDTVREAWSDGARGVGIWRLLERGEAAYYVRALQRLKTRSPLEAGR